MNRMNTPSNENHHGRHACCFLVLLASALVAVIFFINGQARGTPKTDPGSRLTALTAVPVQGVSHPVAGAGELHANHARHRLPPFCKPGHRAQIVGQLRSSVRPDAKQAEKLQQVDQALQQAEPWVAKLCRAYGERDRQSPLPERLENLQANLELGHRIINAVRPSLVRFYASLSVEQRVRLDEAFPRHRRFGHDATGSGEGS